MKSLIGLNIRRLREKKNMTQEELARKTGVGTTAVSQWETEKSVPRGRRLYEIAAALDVTIEELMGFNESESGALSLDVFEEPMTPYEIATDLELRIEAVEKRLNALSRELAELKNRYENQKKE
jgi:transcriptional regulator with XRE-family HTH domain